MSENDFDKKISELDTSQLRQEHRDLLEENLQQKSSSGGLSKLLKRWFLNVDEFSGRTEVNKARTSTTFIIIGFVLFVVLTMLNSKRNEVKSASSLNNNINPAPSYEKIVKTPSMIETLEKNAHDPLPDSEYDAEKYLKEYSPSVSSSNRYPKDTDLGPPSYSSKPSSLSFKTSKSNTPPIKKENSNSKIDETDMPETDQDNSDDTAIVDLSNAPSVKTPGVYSNNPNINKYLNKNDSSRSVNNLVINNTVNKPPEPNKPKDDFIFNPIPGNKILVALEYEVNTSLDRVIIAYPVDPNIKFPENTKFYGKYVGSYKDSVVLYFTAYSINGKTYTFNSVAAQDSGTSIKADKLESVSISDSITTGAARASKSILPSTGSLIDNFLNSAGNSILSNVKTNYQSYDVYHIEKGSTFYLVILPQ